MSQSDKPEQQSAIHEAIRAKRERKTGTLEEVAQLEAALLADIESFDLDAAERRARREYLTGSEGGMTEPTIQFPSIAPLEIPRKAPQPETAKSAESPDSALGLRHGSNLLDQLRQQAELRQREMSHAQAEQSASNHAIDLALKHAFFHLNELVNQLNIVKPAIPRDYPLVDQLSLTGLSWQEGFADFRTQSQSAGALVELTTLSYRLVGRGSLLAERDGAAVDRFRALLFDYGLPFNCKEFKNLRRYVERAEFEILPEISVSARWRAEFTTGTIVLEMRNLERLGSSTCSIRPQAIDQALLDDFAYLVLGQPNRFRELARRT